MALRDEIPLLVVDGRDPLGWCEARPDVVTPNAGEAAAMLGIVEPLHGRPAWAAAQRGRDGRGLRRRRRAADPRRRRGGPAAGRPGRAGAPHCRAPDGAVARVRCRRHLHRRVHPRAVRRPDPGGRARGGAGRRGRRGRARGDGRLHHRRPDRAARGRGPRRAPEPPRPARRRRGAPPPGPPPRVHQRLLRRAAPRPRHLPAAGAGARRPAGGGAQQRRQRLPAQGPRAAGEPAAGPGRGRRRHRVRRPRHGLQRRHPRRP